jgi:hypothetical protein
MGLVSSAVRHANPPMGGSVDTELIAFTDGEFGRTSTLAGAA